jgi:heme-degrading monooxygenase HmoA
MYARTIQGYLVPGMAERAVKIFRDKIAPVVREQPGFVSTAIYINEDKNRAQTVSIWESAEAQSATAQGSDYLAKVSGMLRGTVANDDYGTWEIGHFED